MWSSITICRFIPELEADLTIRIFEALEVREAIEHAKAGGQALHLHQFIVDRSKAPRCFVRAVDRGEMIAHLFDQNKDRLIRTAKSLGVKVIFIDREGTESQHIDLCGKPLKQAMALGVRGES